MTRLVVLISMSPFQKLNHHQPPERAISSHEHRVMASNKADISPLIMMSRQVLGGTFAGGR